MSLTAGILSWSAFIFALIAVLLAPWFFGAWQQWWFWPFFTCLAMSTFLFAARLLVRAYGHRRSDDEESTEEDVFRHHRRGWLLASFIPFILYAIIRTFQADVWMDAERILLLQLSALLLGVQVVSGFSRTQRLLCFGFITVNFICLGAYGIVNHVLTGSSRVLWAPAYELYQAEHRASGSYFCPDHFSGAMELALGIGIACILVRKTHWVAKLAGLVLCGAGLTGVLLSRSRGGGLTIVVMFVVAVVFGFSTWSRRSRWLIRGAFAIAGAAALVLFATSQHPFMKRFLIYFPFSDLRGKPAIEVRAAVIDRLAQTSRGRMISAAWRAWRTNEKTRLWGIGPGMHQNIWPHIAATPDGDRKSGTWPTMPNYDFHSYWVHSDWMQLLEEYGLVGLLLFLIPTGTVLLFMLPKSRAMPHETVPATGSHLLSLAGIMAWTAMAFHSLGDFNLQIPANAWLLAVLVALPLGQLHGRTGQPSQDEVTA